MKFMGRMRALRKNSLLLFCVLIYHTYSKTMDLNTQTKILAYMTGRVSVRISFIKIKQSISVSFFDSYKNNKNTTDRFRPETHIYIWATLSLCDIRANKRHHAP